MTSYTIKSPCTLADLVIKRVARSTAQVFQAPREAHRKRLAKAAASRPVSLRGNGGAAAGAGLLLPVLLPFWTTFTPSFCWSCTVLLVEVSESTPSSSCAPPGGGLRGAGLRLPLLLPCWTRSTPSFAQPWHLAPVSGDGGAAAAVAVTTVLDEVYAFLRAARWLALSWTAAAAATALLD